MKHLTRTLTIAAFTTLAVVAAGAGVFGAPKAAPAGTPSAKPAVSAAPLPMPTATPEDPKVVIPRLEAKLKATPDDRETMLQLAPYYMEGGRPDRALALTQRLMQLGVKSAQVYYLDGYANQLLGRIKEATSDFEQAANLEPTNLQVLATLTSLYMGLNRDADAERVAKRATTFNPKEKQAFENYGLVLAHEKKFDEARQQFETAANLDPKDAQPVILEARSYIDQNAIALAQQLFERALTIDPKNTEAMLGKARLLASNHNVKDAQATYDQLFGLLTSDRERASMLVEEAQMYRAEKLDDQAEKIITKAVADYPNVQSVHVSYGDYLLSKKDEAGAEREWKLALGAQRDNPDALNRLGNLALKQSKIKDAAGYFERLTELLPNEATVWGQAGQVYSFNKQYDKSRDAYRHCFDLSHTPECLSSLAATDFELRNYKECSVIFDALEKNAAAYMKNNPQYYFLAGRCYASNGQKDKARTEYTRLQAFVKPGTQQAKDVQKLLNDLQSKPAPKPSPTPKH